MKSLCWAAERSYCSPFPRWGLVSSHSPTGSLSLDSEMQEQTQATGTCLKILKGISIYYARLLDPTEKDNQFAPFRKNVCPRAWTAFRWIASHHLGCKGLPARNIGRDLLQAEPTIPQVPTGIGERLRVKRRQRKKVVLQIPSKTLLLLDKNLNGAECPQVNRNKIKPNVSESASHKNVFLNGIDSGR